MPYISNENKWALQKRYPRTSGELNYKITELIIKYVQSMGLCYDTINDIMGALEGSKAEFYRRVAAPYEDLKARLNGDVYAWTDKNGSFERSPSENSASGSPVPVGERANTSASEGK